MSNDARVDHASIIVGCDPQTTFEAFSDPDALVRWLPPTGATGAIDTFDFRPGGAFRMTLTFADQGLAGEGKTTADTDRVEAEFGTIDPPRAIEWKVSFVSDDPAFAGLMTMIWTFQPDGTGTRVDVAAHDVPPGIDPLVHVRGLHSSLDNLFAYLEARAVQAD